MKKTIRLTILLVFSSVVILAQNSQTKVADKLFKELSYAKAVKEYKKDAGEKTSKHVLQRIGDSYYYMANLKESYVWYAKLDKNYKITSPEYMFRYAQTLRAIGNYTDSALWMKKFNGAKQNDIRGKDFVENEEKLSLLETPNEGINIKNVESINTKESDFGVTIYNSQLLYSSSAISKRYVERKHTWNNKNFLDVFTKEITNIDKKEDRKEFSKGLNTKYHESSLTFSPDNKTVYFTRNNFNNGNYKEDENGVNNLKIYRAEWKNGEWKNAKELPFSSDDYSIGHPTLTKDGKRLYFTSDMPGTIGQTDIFYVAVNGDGTYGDVQNLGIKVNTEGREMFPYISDDNTLYFSSDGHFGLGGLDIFSSKIEDNIAQEPKNLGTPLNSKLDDFSFVIDATNQNGYLSSNRDGGKGSDDIYSFTAKEIVKPVIVKPCLQLLSGVVKNRKFKAPLPGSKLVITDANGIVVKEMIADDAGEFSLELPCNMAYKIVASKEYYQPATDNFITTKDITLELDLDFDLPIVKEFGYNERDELIIKIEPIYFDYDKSNIRPDAARELDIVVAVMKKYPKIEIRGGSHTDAQGSSAYNEKLSQRRAKSTVAYIIAKGISPSRIVDKGFGETRLTNNCTDNDSHTDTVKCTKEEHQANRRTEFVIIKK